MLQICGVSFILGFTFVNSAVFLNLTLLHTPNKYADCLFPLSVSPWAHKDRRMPAYCPVPFHIGFSAWHNTRWLESQAGLPSLPLAVMTWYVLAFTLFFPGVFFFLCTKGTAGKSIFPMSGGIITILHNLSPFSVGLH